MFRYDDNSVRFTGRWHFDGNTATTVTNGSKIEIAFKGDFAVLRFDIAENINPLPHLYIRVDGGAKTEVPLDAFIRIECEEKQDHIAEIILKSSVATQNRWFAPLQAKVSFLGYDANRSSLLSENNRKTIEFIGDSITEGAFVDADLIFFEKEDDNACYYSDATASYAYLTATALDLEPIITAYAGQGTTGSGCGSVPPAAKAYPFCFDGAKSTLKSADYIVINHGTNDAHNPDTFCKCYEELLEVVLYKNPQSKIAVMVPFMQTFRDKIFEIVNSFNQKHKTDIFFIDTDGWVPKEPIHPSRSSHKKAAELLAAALREYYGI